MKESEIEIDIKIVAQAIVDGVDDELIIDVGNASAQFHSDFFLIYQAAKIIAHDRMNAPPKKTLIKRLP